MGAPSTQLNVGSTSSTTTNDQANSDNNDNVENNNHCNISDLVTTYTSLIQQYLAVMCLDNATFLAERLVATCKTSDTLYLLALCYDRGGSPQKALSVLEDCKTVHTTTNPSLSFHSHGSSSIGSSSNSNSAVPYLKAKCCFDLKQHGPAEDALLQPARALYRQLRVTSDAAGTEPPMPMDTWILSTTVRSYK
jgi:hypothetical protein